METKKMKTFAKLGYTLLDTAEIVTQLNRLLSSYSIYQQKLRSFHWNVIGKDFFELHMLFEEMYKRAILETDEIAERIRLFGQRPASTLKEYLELSEIKENNKERTSYEMVRIILEDMQSILKNTEEVINVAEEIDDHGTQRMLKTFIYNMEKEHWKLSAWMKQNV